MQGGIYFYNLKAPQCLSRPEKVMKNVRVSPMSVISRTLSAIVEKNLSIPAPPHLVLIHTPLCFLGPTSLWALPYDLAAGGGCQSQQPGAASEERDHLFPEALREQGQLGHSCWEDLGP